MGQRTRASDMITGKELFGMPLGQKQFVGDRRCPGGVDPDPRTLPPRERACWFGRDLLFSERRIGTPARLLVPKSAKSGQPTINATGTGGIRSAELSTTVAFDWEIVLNGG